MPAPLTPLVGRASEIDHIVEVLRARATRLLVLTGPGGVGKTRLALAVAQTVEDAFPDGVFLTNLSSATSKDQVLPAIAAAVGINGASATSPPLAVFEEIRDRDMLLVLDNFEQVIDAAPLLTDILMATNSLTMVVTSRSVLGVYGENVFPVAPFRVPDERETSLEKIRESEAVQLFVNRVQAVRPRFNLNQRNARDVGAICRRLDGIPLAIELAAARTSLFTVSDLANRLDERLFLLESRLRNVPDRYRTMRNAIGWSYDLLTPFEQKVFRHLSVFAGAWNLDAVNAMVFGEDQNGVDHELELLNAVGSLVDKSLVQRVEIGDHDRNFVLLQILREFGLSELDAQGEREAAEARHTAYILDFARQAMPHLTGRDQIVWLNQLNLLEADILAVFERLMANTTTDDALELITAVWRYGYARGNILEFRTYLERALRSSTKKTEIRAKALNAAGVLSNMLNDLPRTRRYHEEALEIARAFDNKHHMALALFGLGDIAAMSDNDADAERHYLDAERLYTEIDQTRGIATAQTNLANLYWKQGKLQDALKINEAARRLYEAAGDQRGLAWSYTNVGRLSAELREYAHAAPNLAQAMALYDLIGDRTGIAETLEGYALINIGTRDYSRAATLLGASARLRDEIGHPVPINDRPSLEKMLAELGKSLDGTMKALLTKGRQMELDEAISLAVNTSVPNDPTPRVSIRGEEVRDILDRMGITDRELEVLQKLGSGETDKEIAEHLYISVRTVQTHVQNVLNKFEVTSRSAAVAKAFRIGLLH
jgi:predicted ATPase/DNA-binding CsgD family transcriptional regulator